MRKTSLLLMLLMMISGYSFRRFISKFGVIRNFARISRPNSLPQTILSKKFISAIAESDTALFAGIGMSSKTESDPGSVKGTKLRVLKYPHPQLRQENEIIVSFDENLKKIAQEMFLVMYAAEGIGLAAPQVGINKRLMVFNEMGDAEKPDFEMALVNPVILSQSPGKKSGEEGCLSFPMIYGHVERSEWIEVEYQTLQGEKVVKRFEGRPAVIFQHEYDHLDKVLFIDRLVENDRKMNQKRLDKYVKKYGAGAAA